MLVARKACGCAATALLSEDEPEAISDFLREARTEGWAVQDEQRETITAEKCEEHKHG